MLNTLKQHRARFTAAALIAALLPVGLGIAAPAPAEAGAKGRRNTTAALGAATAYFLIKGETRTGLGLGAATAVSYLRYRSARKRELCRQRCRRHHRFHCRRCH